HDHPRPPDWWHRTPRQRIGTIARGAGPVWRPTGRTYIASRPADRGWANESHGVIFHQPERPDSGRPVARPAEGPGAPRPGVEPSRRPIEPRPQTRAPVINTPAPRIEPRLPAQAPPRIEAPRAEPPPAFESRPASSGVGVFGGPQNPVEARQSS